MLVNWPVDLLNSPTWRTLFTHNSPLTVAIEWQEGEGKKQMLGSLPPGPKRVSSAVASVIGWLWRLGGRGKWPSMIQINQAQFLELLLTIDPGDPSLRLTPGREAPLALAVEPIRPRLAARPLPDGGTTLELELLPNMEPLVTGEQVWFWSPPNHLHRLAAPLPTAYSSLLQAPVTLAADQAAAFFTQEYPTLGRWFQLDPPAVPSPMSETPESGRAGGPMPPGLPEVVLELDGSLLALTACVQFRYGKRLITPGVTPDDEPAPHTDPEGRPRRRNRPFEQAALARLVEWRFSSPDRHGRMTLRGEREILAFFVQGHPKLAKEWTVTIGSRFGRVSERFDWVRPEMAVRGTGEDWFEIDVQFADGSGKPWAPAEVQRLLRSGRSYEKREDGRITLVAQDDMTSLEAFLREGNPVQNEGGYRLSKRQAVVLDQVAADGAGGFRLRGREQLKRWLPEGASHLELGSFESILRPYQKEGVQWLNFLAINGLGGILADEMGLGKTVQTLAFLARSDRQGQPTLVVCPSSLVWNWERESRRFAPELHVINYSGPDRAKRRDAFAQADLIITSYAILRRDQAFLAQNAYFTVVLDEAHHIKNPDTQNARAANDLSSHFRLVLTGTPIENSLMDLWSLMQFCNPGLLGDKATFKNAYMSESQESDKTLLRNRLKAFITRRTKLEKVRELPPKLIQVSQANATPEQMTGYHSVMRGIEELRAAAKAEKHGGKRRAILLTGLLRLRQAASDLRLLRKEGDLSDNQASGKWAVFSELLQECLDGGHRVLVFSQFVEMLQLLRRHLDEAAVRYAYLDGSTTDREAVVTGFQEGDAPVFLISLKAGGVGLNLTAADTVILFDPWWNPAVEDQAMDRAHRIGQERPVNVYKLITVGTVEEKILALQEKKRKTAAALFEEGELSTAGLTTEELEALLT